MSLLARLHQQFDLDINSALITAHLQLDMILAARLKALLGIRVPGTFAPFELAIRAILGQQVSVAGAGTLIGHLVSRYGTLTETSFAKVTPHFPDANVLASLPVSDLASISIPTSQAVTLRNMAQYAADGRLQCKPGTSLGDVIAQLTSIPGVSNWTPHYIALRPLRFPDAFPFGDLGLQKVMAKAGERLTEKQLAALAAAWSP